MWRTWGARHHRSVHDIILLDLVYIVYLGTVYDLYASLVGTLYAYSQEITNTCLPQGRVKLILTCKRSSTEYTVKISA